MLQSETVKKYDTYKDSGIEWIGEIPQEWGLTKIGQIYDERNEKVSDKDYQPLSVTKNGVVPQLETAAKTDNGDNRKLVKINDFAINSRSDRRGSCGISEYEGSVSLINTVLSPRNNMCNKYYNYTFKSECFADEFYKWGNGIVDDLWSTKWSAMKNIYIPNPKLEEQIVIAEYLDKKCGAIDEVIETEKSVIEKLKEYKQSIITEAVTKGLDKSVPLKDSGIEWIGKIPQHWEIIKLKKTIRLIADIDHYMPDTTDAGYSYLMTGDLKEIASKIDFENCKHISESDYKDLSKKIHPILDDVIFARYATIGTVCYVDIQKDFLVSYSCLTIRPNSEKLFGKFLYYYLISDTFKIEVSQYINSNTQSNVGLDSLQKVYMVLPNKAEQQQIAEYLDKKCSEIDEAIADKEQVIEKFTEYKKSLIYECVTGKRKVVD